MDRLINTALVLISVMAWMYRKYGMLPLLTGKVAKHAACGRASRKAAMHWLGSGHRLEGLRTPAAQVIANLRAERSQSSWVLAA